MRRPVTALLLILPLAAAETIDRVVVAVGLQVITGSAVRRRVKLDAFLAGTPAETGEKVRRAAAERLVDQALVRREVELTRFPAPSMADTLAQAARQREGMKLDEAGLAAALRIAGLSEEAFLDEIRWQITLFRFIDFRFRPAVQVDDDEVRGYYEGEFRRELEKTLPGENVPPLEEVRVRIAAILAERKLQTALEQWLEQSRQLVKIRWREEALR